MIKLATIIVPNVAEADAQPLVDAIMKIADAGFDGRYFEEFHEVTFLIDQSEVCKLKKFDKTDKTVRDLAMYIFEYTEDDASLFRIEVQLDEGDNEGVAYITKSKYNNTIRCFEEVEEFEAPDRIYRDNFEKWIRDPNMKLIWRD